MAEVVAECTHVWAHKLRIATFFSAMRHFREELLKRNIPVEYYPLPSDPLEDEGETHTQIIDIFMRQNQIEPGDFQSLVVVQPGDYRVLIQLREWSVSRNINLQILTDAHFLVSPEEFEKYTVGKKTLVMEYFYREQRKKYKILVDEQGKPEGGAWNYDSDNRKTFGKTGPQEVPQPPSFSPDQISKEVCMLVEQRFPDHPGNLSNFNVPVTHKQANRQLTWFIEEALPNFGPYEDAMWSGEPFLYHSRLSIALNLKLISPLVCIQKAIDAYENGKATLASVEGFVRQVLGWREFIRGVYWKYMPDYEQKNALEAKRNVPTFFWDGNTEMACVKDTMQSVLDHGYAHHIQRLMILGNLAQLIGVHPHHFHTWHMAMYLDAVDWVSLPNALGMSQFGDGGIVGTKPYCSTGNYINKMSNFCKNCRFNYKKKSGENACPFTALYWDFLDRNKEQLMSNPRMKFAYNNLEKLKSKPGEYEEMKTESKAILQKWYPEDQP